MSDLNSQLADLTTHRDQLVSTLETRRAESDADRVERDATYALVSELNGGLERITVELQLRHRALVASFEADMALAPPSLARPTAAGAPRLGSPSRQGWHVDAIRSIVQLGDQRVENMAMRVQELVAEQTTLGARNRDLIEKLRGRSRSDTLELDAWRHEVAGVAVDLLASLEQVAATLAGRA